MRDFHERRRDVEAALDRIAEHSTDTDGDLATTDVTLRVADDLFDVVAAFCQIEPAIHKTSRGVAWREASGTFRNIRLRIATAAKRRVNAA